MALSVSILQIIFFWTLIYFIKTPSQKCSIQKYKPESLTHNEAFKICKMHYKAKLH